MLNDEYYVRPSKYGSVKITGTDLTEIEAHTIRILEDATIAILVDDGLPSGTSAITWHGISSPESADIEIYAAGKFTSIQLSGGKVVIF